MYNSSDEIQKIVERLLGEKLKRLLTVEETAKRLGMSPRTIYNQLSPNSERKFPIRPKRINRSIKFDIRDIDSYIDSL